MSANKMQNLGTNIGVHINPVIGQNGVTFINYSWFRATSNFRKFKVALNSMYRIFLNFAKSCISSCLSKFYNKEKFHRAVFEIVARKAEIMGVFSRS